MATGVTVEAWETASMSGYLATDHTVTRMVQLLNRYLFIYLFIDEMNDCLFC